MPCVIWYFFDGPFPSLRISELKCNQLIRTLSPTCQATHNRLELQDGRAARTKGPSGGGAGLPTTAALFERETSCFQSRCGPAAKLRGRYRDLPGTPGLRPHTQPPPPLPASPTRRYVCCSSAPALTRHHHAGSTADLMVCCWCCTFMALDKGMGTCVHCSRATEHPHCLKTLCAHRVSPPSLSAPGSRCLPIIF